MFYAKLAIAAVYLKENKRSLVLIRKASVNYSGFEISLLWLQII